MASIPEVLREAHRVLKIGGRLAISDVITTAPIPDELRTSAAAFSGCLGGAIDRAEFERMLTEAGFSEINIVPRDESRAFIFARGVLQRGLHVRELLKPRAAHSTCYTNRRARRQTDRVY